MLKSIFVMDKNPHHIFFTKEKAAFSKLLTDGNFSKFFLLTDENCARHCLPVFKNIFPQQPIDEIFTVPAGEDSKNLETAQKLWEKMMTYGDRQSLLINLGGGMISDLGGFVASLFKRGIAFANIPTSLLAMVDASIGGKTAVNFKAVKNQIGCFSNPYAVYIDSTFLKTLAVRELKSGFAEMIKIALAASRELFCQLSDIENLHKEIDELMIRNAALLKMEIVESDPMEKGKRTLLNLGHTAGHAFESYSARHDALPLTHGEAVAQGILCEALIAVEQKQLQDDDFETIKELIFRFFDKYNFGIGALDEILNLMIYDKKNRNGKINFTLPFGIGDALINRFASAEEIKKALQKYLEL